ncbi:hypothetical protein [Singulisphaera acidiphila]|uniref:Uncharacterized protein n=1 Tax=Singulisphaera acidiphila (strain ATCC BAA-1392 / DSM 18658 / VKM B-2454 / MOB10) TaxID=886293 RepID=L0DPH1_SINAD|nr:hypothetical protein [Singulisphaera acidiphila]AGA30715.1 hypothetical protein Sinac_6640 [Singulisphaera acidiphila DSM 18658]
MEPREPAISDDLQGLRIDILRQALEIYLTQAYPAGSPPEVVRRRLAWPSDVEPMTLLTRPPFERVGNAGGGASPIYALRLGNLRYPHMKLQIQPWPNEAGFMLSVNTHDQVLAIDPASSDAQAFRDLQAENQRLKEAIEAAWDKAGLPTFLSYLRRYIEDRAGAGSHTPPCTEHSEPEPGPASDSR